MNSVVTEKGWTVASRPIIDICEPRLQEMMAPNSSKPTEADYEEAAGVQDSARNPAIPSIISPVAGVIACQMNTP